MHSKHVPWIRATFRNAFDSFARHRLPRQAATLAYYTLFSLAPLLVITLVIARAVLGDRCVEAEALAQLADAAADPGECVDTTVFEQLASVVGSSMAATVESLVTAQEGVEYTGSFWAAVVGGLLLFIGASGMFQALQDALNTVWDIPIDDVRGLLRSLVRRLYGVVAVFVIGVLVSIFVVGAAVVVALAREIGERIGGLNVVVQTANVIVAFLGISVVSALVFQWLPARRVPWRAAWAGGVLTTVLLGVGSSAIGLLFAVANPGAAFGAFAAIIVLLVYIYYTAQIFLFGAELTAAYVQVRIEGETPG